MPATLPGEEPAILSLEDQSESVSSALDELAFQGCAVDTCGDTDTAAELLSKKRYHLLLLDQRVPSRTTFHDDGGTRLVERLRAGEFGDLNRLTPFLMITADARWVDESVVASMSGYRGLLVKTAALRVEVLSICEDVMPWWRPYDHTRAEAEENRVAVTLVRLRSDNPLLGDERADIVLRVPSWDADKPTMVPRAHFPDYVLEEIEQSRDVVFIQGTINLGARTAQDLFPSDFEPSVQLEPGEDLASFGNT